MIDYLNKIAATLSCEFDYLFPEEYIDAIKNSKLSRFSPPMQIKDVKIDELPPGEKALQLPSPEQAVFDSIMCEDIEELLDILKPNERVVIEKHYGIGTPRMTYRAIAEELDLSTTRIRQIEAQALSRFRHPSIRRKVREYI